MLIALFVYFPDLKTDVFTTADNSSYISQLEKTYSCVVEIRTRG